MIALEEVRKTYLLGKTKVEALKGVSLQINKGEMVCLMGPSGSGKSTLLNLAGCLDRPDSGKIWIDGEEVSLYSLKKLAGIRSSKIGFIFQAFNLIPVINVYENIEFPLMIKKEKISEKEKKTRIDNLIQAVGLEKFAKHRPDELSGGQRQRVAIARALVSSPEIVFADEPTANLDSETGKTILELLASLNQNKKTTFVFATHDPSITRYATSLFQMKDGILSKKEI